MKFGGDEVAAGVETAVNGSGAGQVEVVSGRHLGLGIFCGNKGEGSIVPKLSFWAYLLVLVELGALRFPPSGRNKKQERRKGKEEIPSPPSEEEDDLRHDHEQGQSQNKDTSSVIVALADDLKDQFIKQIRAQLEYYCGDENVRKYINKKGFTKVVVKIMTMNDEKTKKKAIEAVADIYGVDSIAADVKEQKLTVIGEMDTVVIAKKLKKIGKVDIVTVGPAKEEKKDDKKDDKKGEKKDEKKDEKK
ncbi:Putative late blight resistance R1B-12 [Gossypium arboreum]|uniref:Uncharacterized protein n=3 Tax=Gossypium arboreum TaxID=29729 RepID=A0ABR0MUK9_GOSAR|nr:hypothetical protein PVK06_045626 [Gossypium arboreum]KHG02036.1 Putative late blight resistance R1B-12 [Gossypium arboreum]